MVCLGGARTEQGSKYTTRAFCSRLRKLRDDGARLTRNNRRALIALAYSMTHLLRRFSACVVFSTGDAAGS
eukprot:6212236-Pleurochrysis_carterae.AAC.2